MHGYPRAHRLLKPEQFNRVFRRGRKRFFQPIVFVECINDVGHARIGFAISKKRIRRAVQRNRVKRVVRECFRQTSYRLPSIDIVVLAATEAGIMGNKQLTERINAYLQQCVQSSSG